MTTPSQPTVKPLINTLREGHIFGDSHLYAVDPQFNLYLDTSGDQATDFIVDGKRLLAVVGDREAEDKKIKQALGSGAIPQCVDTTVLHDGRQVSYYGVPIDATNAQSLLDNSPYEAAYTGQIGSTIMRFIDLLQKINLGKVLKPEDIGIVTQHTTTDLDRKLAQMRRLDISLFSIPRPILLSKD